MSVSSVRTRSGDPAQGLPAARAALRHGAWLGMALLAGCHRAETEPPVPLASARQPALALPLNFCAFSGARVAFHTKVLPQFALQWRREHGQRVEFTERYEGSGMLAQAIAAGFAADVAVFSRGEDVERLVQAGLVDHQWREAPHEGIVSHSLVVLAVRKGNPKNIRDWRDLTRPGIRIASPDPTTSGGGVWNVCAIYGAALRGHAGVPARDRKAAFGFLAMVLANVVERKPSARESFESFQSGVGDVAITYESEVALGWAFGHDEERVIPGSTLLVQNAAVLIDKNVDAHGVRALATEFLTHLWSVEAQTRLAFFGLRPVVPEVMAGMSKRFPRPADLWTVADLGGWDQVVREILAPAGLESRAAAPGR